MKVVVICANLRSECLNSEYRGLCGADEGCLLRCNFLWRQKGRGEKRGAQKPKVIETRVAGATSLAWGIGFSPILQDEIRAAPSPSSSSSSCCCSLRDAYVWVCVCVCTRVRAWLSHQTGRRVDEHPATHRVQPVSQSANFEKIAPCLWKFLWQYSLGCQRESMRTIRAGDGFSTVSEQICACFSRRRCAVVGKSTRTHSFPEIRFDHLNSIDAIVE